MMERPLGLLCLHDIVLLSDGDVQFDVLGLVTLIVSLFLWLWVERDCRRQNEDVFV